PYTALTEKKSFKIGTSRQEYEFLLPNPLSEGSATIFFVTYSKNLTFWLDNVQLSEADVTVKQPEDLIRFEYNATGKTKTITLDGNYFDVKNKTYSGSLTITPYTSVVLIKDGLATTESSTTSNCSSTGSILREYWDNIS